MITLAIPASATEPGWGKLAAIFVAVGVFLVFRAVHTRVKRVRDGAEVNPFSSEGAQAGEITETQVSTPSGKTGTAPGKGVRKWFRKG
jgi:hypothetical protein